MFFTGWQTGFACCSHSKSKGLENLLVPGSKKVLKKKKKVACIKGTQQTTARSFNGQKQNNLSNKINKVV